MLHRLTAFVLLSLLVAAGLPAATAGATSADTVGSPSGPTTALLEVTETIDDLQVRYIERALEEARARGATTIITRIHSPGGYVSSAMDLFDTFLDLSRDGIRLVAHVDQSAYSAAAMLAYAHDAVYLERGAQIGDIGVIYQTSEGIEYAPEKFKAPVRALLRTAAQERGWPEALMVKMTEKDQELYEVRHPDGRREYVIASDKSRYLADHPEVDAEDPTMWVEIMGKDTLLTVSAKEALEMGLATAIVSNQADLLQRLEISEADLIDLSPTKAESWARALGGWTPLFAALTILFIVFELKTAGVGLFAILAGICGVLFLLTQYSLDLMNHIELVLFLLGVALVAVDALTLFGGGLLAALGALVAITGLGMAFLPNGIQPGDTGFVDALATAGQQTVVSLTIVSVGIIAAIILLPRTALMRRLEVAATIAGTSAGTIETEAESARGQRARVVGDLHPGGTVEVDGVHYTAQEEHGRFVATGAEVEIVGTRFGELLVRVIEDPEEAQA